MNKDRAMSCAYTIYDNVQAILAELQRDTPYVPYIVEKLQPIKNDVNCLDSMLK